MRKLFETLAIDGTQAIVRGKNEHGEFVVRLYETLASGTYENKNAVYFTDDLDDACGTACAMAEHHSRICPACRAKKLDEVLARNSSSRYVRDAYVCNDCGTREAFEGPFWYRAAKAWEETKRAVHANIPRCLVD